MTEFKFYVSDVISAKKSIKIIDKKFNSNDQVKKMIYRDINYLGDNLFKCEFILPFPDLRMTAWFFLFTNIIIFYFYRHIWIFLINFILFLTSYGTQYLLSEKYHFKMLKKGMLLNGYKGNIRRV